MEERPHSWKTNPNSWKSVHIHGRPNQIHGRPVHIHGRPIQIHVRAVHIHGNPIQIHGRPVQIHGWRCQIPAMRGQPFLHQSFALCYRDHVNGHITALHFTVELQKQGLNKWKQTMETVTSTEYDLAYNYCCLELHLQNIVSGDPCQLRAVPCNNNQDHRAHREGENCTGKELIKLVHPL